MLPTPLNEKCNPHFRRPGLPDFGNCEYAALALAIWRAFPEKFAAFDHWLALESSPPAGLDLSRFLEAWDHAQALIGDVTVEEMVADPWVRRQLEMNVALYGENIRISGVEAIPQQFFGSTLSMGASESERDLLRMIERHFGLKPEGP
jgi:hypothetical protein